MKATSSTTSLGHASVLAALLLILASLACNLGAGSTGNQTEGGQPDETSATSAAKPAQEPNPLRVSVDLDAETRAAEVISVSGGSLTAIGSDGTRYTLVIPENALLSDQEIRMTPVSSIDGLPFSNGLVAAVDLKPEGLLLFAPATLTIEPAQGVSPKDLLGFSYNHEGEELFLYPMEATDTSITISVMHFTGFGGGSGTASDSDSMGKYPPSSSEDQAMQAGANAANAARDSGGDIPYDEWEVILRDWYNSSVAPNLNAAATDDSAMEKAITEYLRWAKEVAMDGLNDRFERELALGQRGVSVAIKNAIDKSSKRCSSQGNPTEARRLIRLAKMAQFLGALGGSSDTSGYRPVYENAEKALIEVTRCGRFELKFDSTIETLSGCQTNFVSKVRATVALSVEQGIDAFISNQYKGEGKLEYVEFTAPSGCPEQEDEIMCPAQNTDKQDSTFRVKGATLFNLNISEEADAQPPSIDVVYFVGSPIESMIVKCPDAEPAEVFQLMEELGLGQVRMWRNGYQATHEDEMMSLDGVPVFVAQDWEYSGGSPYARKVYQGKRGETELGFSVTEDTTIELFFKPGR